ncbi:Beta-galactosidase 16 [Platanthera guangdongensis]|uniref:beta-galactosidase n=1 Tax=Platanthera guangdongensis TaxID=2320717 RepID=A0ABR2M917_9ASPA
MPNQQIVAGNSSPANVKMHMEAFVSYIVKLMKGENLYASQGGPIILSQIENEYQTYEQAFHEKGKSYVKWAANMAVGLQTGVPWMMCKQEDAPDPVINTCNGMNCGETFKGPNSPNKPSLWTENWTSFYHVYGDEPYIRSAEDIAFAVAMFIAKKSGSFVNYYMYHGGTNFGRTSSSYVITAYYDQAPLDEYGLIWQPKWAHLRELHAAVKVNSEALLMGSYSNFSVGRAQEVSSQAHVFLKDSGKCVAFLVNNDSANEATIQFWNATFELPRKSISILSECQNVVFNTAKVAAQYGTRSAEVVENFNQASRWKVTHEKIPSTTNSSAWVETKLLEQTGATKDSSDYLWYTTRYTKTQDEENIMLNVNSLAHVIHAFVNNEYVGTVHGSHGRRAASVLTRNISLNNGQNEISLLSVMVGLPDSGAHLERRVAGLRRVRILNSKSQFEDLGNNLWTYQQSQMLSSSRLQPAAMSEREREILLSVLAVSAPGRWPTTRMRGATLGSRGSQNINFDR